MMTSNNNRGNTYKRVGTVLGVTILIFIIAFIVLNRVSLDKLPDYISSGEYDKVVTAYNKYAAGDAEREKDCKDTIEKVIADIVMAWSDDEMAEEDAASALETLSAIDNRALSNSAKKNRNFIILESKSDRLYEEAEEAFREEAFLDALKYLVKIDKSYSQYECVEDFTNECVEILIAEVSYPTSIREYEECHAKVKEYLQVLEAPEFVQKDKQMTEEYSAFVTAAPVLEEAKEAFDNGDYSVAFETLEVAKAKDAENRIINDELDELHNTFIVGKVQEVSEAIKKEDDDKALEIIKAAIEIYDCEELRDVKKYVYEEKYPIYKFGNNIVAKITTLFSRWTSEDFDVIQARNDAGAYIVRSGKKMALGDYDESEVTLLSVSGEVATSLIGVDMAMDVRDLSYDVTHWGEEDYFALRLATDAVALIPVVGAVKYLKYSKEAKAGVKTAKAVIGGTSVAAKRTNKILNTSTDLGKNSDESVAVAKVLFKRYTKINTINQCYVGKVYPGTDVKFKMQKVKYKDGRKLKGAFPVFKSKQNMKLPKDFYKENEGRQFKWCTAHLQTLAKKGKLDKKFSKEELEIIKSGELPKGYTWHHHEKEGWMQLVDSEAHNKVAHMGGMSLWGKGYGKNIPEDVSKSDY